jgi:hypothetical protein
MKVITVIKVIRMMSYMRARMVTRIIRYIWVNRAIAVITVMKIMI